MRYVTFITTAILAFALGVLMSFTFGPSKVEQPEIPPISQSMEDDWHRLFEAAYMAKDEAVRDDVIGRLQCLSHDGSLKAHPVYSSDDVQCGRFDSSMETSRMEPEYFSQILKTHGSWSRKNMPFIRSIAAPAAARLYIKERLSKE